MEWSTLSYNFSFFQVTLILTWVIDSPISPESWLMSLLFVVIITMIKQGYEDYLRSITFPFHLINMMTKDWPWAGQCVQKVNCLLIFDQLPLKRRPQHLLQLFTPKTNHFILPFIGGDYQARLSKVLFMGWCLFCKSWRCYLQKCNMRTKRGWHAGAFICKLCLVWMVFRFID